MKSGTVLTKACWILNNQGPYELCKRTWNYIKKHGLKGFWFYNFNASAYRDWLKKESAQVENTLESAAEDIAHFHFCPTISIVMPTYNTRAEFLVKAIRSVCSQVYPFWELCIADDASTEPHVVSLLNQYKEGDSRIRVVRLPQNTGIVGASNQALNLATGEYVGLMDHDDELAPHALLEVVRLLNQSKDTDIIYTDEDRLLGNGARSDPFFKPGWSPDLLMSMNYIGHFMVVKRTLFEKVDGFREGTDGSQDYDLILRLTELTGRIAHVSQILYHWRMTPGSVSSETESRGRALEAGRAAIEEALMRRGIDGQVTIIGSGRYRVKYQIKDEPLISIIIPTRNRSDMLSRCLDSIQSKSTYQNYEVIVVDNGSTDENTLNYLREIAKNDGYFVLRIDELFNYSRINNCAVREARGDYVLFLNNDTEVITPNWLEEMLSHAQRPGIGAVGAKLIFPDKTIQHGGVTVGIGRIAGHAFYGLPEGAPGYMGLLEISRNCMAVTAACLMIKKDVFNEVGGFDEELDVAYNDVDLCLKIKENSYMNIWTPYACLYHYESATRGYSLKEENIKYFCDKWNTVIEHGDQYYNPNLSLSHCDFRINY